MPEQSPTDLLQQSLAQAQEHHQLFPPTQTKTPLPVIVGVSGGADSVCLLHLLTQFVHPWNLALHVAHLDHSVRPDSAEDATFVRNLAASMDLPFHTRQLAQIEIDAAANNLEAALRRLRYAFLCELAVDLAHSDAAHPTVAVAHNADDQVETILMHMLRGSGLAGLVGMRPVSLLSVEGASSQSVRLVRPLLDVPRTHILQYLDGHRLTWREDPSNQNLAFTRNHLRHSLLPQIKKTYPNLTSALTRLGAVMSAEYDRAEHWNRQAFHKVLHQSDASKKTGVPDRGTVIDRVVIDRAAFRDLDLATQRGVLRCTASYVGVPLDEMNYDRTEILRSAVVSNRVEGPIPLAGQFDWSTETERFSLHQRSVLAFSPEHPFLDFHWRALYGAESLPVGGELSADKWRLTCTELELDELPAHWKDNRDPWQAYCDAWRVGELLLTTPRRGQQFAPLGMQGRHKSLGDFFTDNKVPIAIRSGWPLLLDGASGEILWVCGLRLAHRARIRPETRRIYHLSWSKE